MKLALRRLAQSPGFTTVAVATLGLGLAVAILVLAFFQATVLRPLRVPQPDQLVQVWSANRDGSVPRPAISWPLYRRIAEARDIFSGAAAALPTGFTIRDGVAPLSVGGVRITGNLPTVLGVHAVLGRTFSAGEDAAGGATVAMVSEAFWKTHLGARTNVIGETLDLDGVPHEIVGVLPSVLSQLFAGDAVYVPRPFEIPNAPREAVERGSVPYQVIGRLRPGVASVAADVALRTVVETYRQDAPQNTDAPREPSTRLLVDQLASASRPVVTALLGIAACSLAIACGSLGSLVLLRLLTRARDCAVRFSLGATRQQVAAGPLCEVGIIVASGFAIAVGLAVISLPPINRLTLPYLPRLPAAELTLGIVGAAALVVLIVGTGLVVLTRWFVRGVHVADALHSRSRATPATTRTHRVLVAGQIAATLALVTSALLLGANIRKLTHTEPGFEPEGLATAFVNLPRARYAAGENRLKFFNAALERVRHSPGITGAAVVSIAPLTRIIPPGAFAVAGRSMDPTDQPTAIVRVVSDDYFSTLRLPLREGRLPLERDARPVAALSSSLARRLFPNDPAVGKILLLGPNGGTPTEIVGIVGDLRANGLALDSTDEIYVPLNATNAGPQMAFVVRTDGRPESIHATLRTAVAEVDAQQSVAVFQTLPSLVGRSVWPQRVAAAVAGTFATSSTVFALLGLFGLMSLWVAQRTKEWGLRSALGASPPRIVAHVLGSAGIVIVIGTGAGLVLAFAANRTLRSLLVGIDPTDLRLLGGAALGFAAVSFLACVTPAARAARVNPTEALRTE